MEDVHVRECLVIHSAGRVAIKHTNDTRCAQTVMLQITRKPVGKKLYCSAEAHPWGKGEGSPAVTLDRN